MLDCVKCIFTIWLLSVAHLILGQAQFQNKSQKYLAAIPVKSVMPGAAIDINGDLIDDIVALDKGVLLKTIKSFGGNFSLELQDSLKVAISTEWSMTAGDINNDGTMDVITSGENNQSTLVPLKRNNLTKKSFATGVYAQGSNTVDINRDGWLDYFLCNDSGHSKIYINDQKGNLKLTTVIDFSINDLTDGSGNYNSEWIDVNNDFLPDLCIAKCKAGVTDPTDLRRVNRLYINQGNGQFVESGAAYQLNSGAQSWVTVFGDLDNDGDLDFVVGNLGLNTPLKATVEQPITLYYDDFDQNGRFDPFIAYFNQGKAYPLAGRDEALEQLVPLRKRFIDYKSYAAATAEEVLGKDGLARATKLMLNETQSGILWNNKGKLTFQALPLAAQTSPIYAIVAGDFDGDGKTDILLAGNQSKFRIRIGKTDANYGTLLRGNGKGDFEYLPQYQSGLNLVGDIRDQT